MLHKVEITQFAGHRLVKGMLHGQGTDPFHV